MTVTTPETAEASEAPQLETKNAAAARPAVVGTPVSVAPEGIVEAIVSVTGIPDEVNDIIVPGAYRDTLTKRRPKVIRNHQWNEQVGRVLDIVELLPGDPRLPKDTKSGKAWPAAAGALLCTIQYNLATKRGRDAFADVKFYAESKEAEFSIGYQVPDGASYRDRRTGIRHIKALDLFEVSDVLFGAASLSMALNVKNAGQKAGLKADPTDEATDEAEEVGEPAPVAAEVPGADEEDTGELTEEELAALHTAAVADPEFPDAVRLAEDVALPPLGDATGENDTGEDTGEGDEGAPLVATLAEVKAKFTAADRDKLAKDKVALPDGSYPIRNAEDLANAITALGRAKDTGKARRHIIRRARALGLLDKLPDGWLTKKGQTKALADPVDPVSGVPIGEHSYFPAEDSLSCDCGLGADHELHTDDPQTKALYTGIEHMFEQETKAADPGGHGGNINKLRAWYLNPARSKIPWGKPGDWAKCVRIAKKHMPKPDQAEGFCANLHKAATGEWPGKNAHGGKAKAKAEGKSAEPAVESTATGQTTTVSTEVTWSEPPVTGDGTGEALPPIIEGLQTKLREWNPAAEVGEHAAHRQPAGEVKRGVGPGFDDSLEARREAIRAAVCERLGRDEDRSAPQEEVMLLGTWPDKVIATRIAYDDAGVAAQQAYSVGYRVEGGAVVLDEPERVDLTIDPLTDTEPCFDALVLSSTIGTAVDEAVFAGKLLAARAGMEVKAGRVLSQINATRLEQAVTALITVLEAAGINIVPPSKMQVEDAQKDNEGLLGAGGEPVITPDTTSPQAREGKALDGAAAEALPAGGAVLSAEEVAAGLAVLGDAALLGPTG